MIHDENCDVQPLLNAVEARILGSLIEKQMATPDYYPLTQNALLAACNQKTNRMPIMNLSAQQVGTALAALRQKGLVTARFVARTDRFEQHLSRKLGLSRKEQALLAAMLLRGPQTLAELRIQAERLVEIDSIDEMNELLGVLIARDEPLALRLPRGPGQREDRYVHLLCGMPEHAQNDDAPDQSEYTDRLSLLEERVAKLEAALARLSGEHEN